MSAARTDGSQRKEGRYLYVWRLQTLGMQLASIGRMPVYLVQTTVQSVNGDNRGRLVRLHVKSQDILTPVPSFYSCLAKA
jgi:hypothetical protein